MPTVESLHKEAQKQGLTDDQYCASVVLRAALPYRDSFFTEQVIKEYHETLIALLPNVPGVSELKMPPAGDDFDALENYAVEMAPLFLQTGKAPSSKASTRSDEPSPVFSTRTSEEDRDEWDLMYDAYRTLSNPESKKSYDSRGTPANELLYKRLGLIPVSSIEEVRKAFKAKALAMHPDKKSLRREQPSSSSADGSGVTPAGAATPVREERPKGSRRPPSPIPRVSGMNPEVYRM